MSTNCNLQPTSICIEGDAIYSTFMYTFLSRKTNNLRDYVDFEGVDGIVELHVDCWMYRTVPVGFQLNSINFHSYYSFKK